MTLPNGLRYLLAIEQGPTLLIAQPLVVMHKLSDLDGKLCTLPLALLATSLFTLIFRSHRGGVPSTAAATSLNEHLEMT